MEPCTRNAHARSLYTLLHMTPTGCLSTSGHGHGVVDVRRQRYMCMARRLRAQGHPPGCARMKQMRMPTLAKPRSPSNCECQRLQGRVPTATANANTCKAEVP